MAIDVVSEVSFNLQGTAMAAIQTLPPTILPGGQISTTPSVSTKSISRDQQNTRGSRPRTITELVDLRAEENPLAPIISYPSKGLEYVDYSYSDLQSYTRNAAALLAQNIAVRQSSYEPEKVVALLGPSDFAYFINAVALSRLGFTVLYLSTRLADAAYISLLNATSCSNIIYYPSFEQTVNALKKSMPQLGAYLRLTEQQYSQTMPYQGSALDPDHENQKICWVIHSSGSTGMPKPIYQTHDAALAK